MEAKENNVGIKNYLFIVSIGILKIFHEISL